MSMISLQSLLQTIWDHATSHMNITGAQQGLSCYFWDLTSFLYFASTSHSNVIMSHIMQPSGADQPHPLFLF